MRQSAFARLPQGQIRDYKFGLTKLILLFIHFTCPACPVPCRRELVEGYIFECGSPLSRDCRRAKAKKTAVLFRETAVRPNQGQSPKLIIWNLKLF